MLNNNCQYPNKSHSNQKLPPEIEAVYLSVYNLQLTDSKSAAILSGRLNRLGSPITRAAFASWRISRWLPSFYTLGGRHINADPTEKDKRYKAVYDLGLSDEQSAKILREQYGDKTASKQEFFRWRGHKKLPANKENTSKANEDGVIRTGRHYYIPKENNIKKREITLTGHYGTKMELAIPEPEKKEPG